MIVECFEIGVERAFEGRCGSKIKIDDVSRVVCIFMDWGSTAFLMESGEVMSPQRDCIKHIIFIVEVRIKMKGKNDHKMKEIIKYIYMKVLVYKKI